MREELIEIAYNILLNNDISMEFNELWQKVIKAKQLAMDYAIEYISDFYTDLTLDNRFVAIEKTQWDLRARRTIKETMLDTSLFEDEEDLEYIEEE